MARSLKRKDEEASRARPQAAPAPQENPRDLPTSQEQQKSILEAIDFRRWPTHLKIMILLALAGSVGAGYFLNKEDSLKPLAPYSATETPGGTSLPPTTPNSSESKSIDENPTTTNVTVTPIHTRVIDVQQIHPGIPPQDPSQYPAYERKQAEFTSIMLGMQNEWRQISLESLGMFADAHPMAAELLNFMEQHAFISIPYGPVTTMRIFNDSSVDPFKETRDSYEFEMVFMPPEYAQNMGGSLITEGRTIRAATTFKSQEWLGIMLGHELSHIYDLTVHGEDPNAPDQWVAGEVMAHLFEMHLLRAWNPQAFREVTTKGLEIFMSKGEDAFIHFARQLYKLTPENVSPREMGLGIASVEISMLFTHVLNQQGKTLDDLDLASGMPIKLLKQIYPKEIEALSNMYLELLQRSQ